MSAVLMKEHLPSEAGVSDTYNRVPMRRAIGRRDGQIVAEVPVTPRRERLRVLIVDDYRASADTMATLVGAWGHDVRRAYDGATGLALAAAYQPDVLLLDIAMSEICGIESAMQVRPPDRLNDCLMIAVTGRADARHRQQCEEVGIDLFLIKPIDHSYLRTLLSVESDYQLWSRRIAAAQHEVAASSQYLLDTAWVEPIRSRIAHCRQLLAGEEIGGRAC